METLVFENFQRVSGDRFDVQRVSVKLTHALQRCIDDALDMMKRYDHLEGVGVSEISVSLDPDFDDMIQIDIKGNIPEAEANLHDAIYLNVNRFTYTLQLVSWDGEMEAQLAHGRL